jgi:FMN phosphatase YigB (HAD superfamily)
MNYNFLKDYKNIVFDYDGTISRIPIDWLMIRSDFISFAYNTFEFTFEKSLRVDEMERVLLSEFPKNIKRIFEFRSKVETVYNGKHLNNKKLIDFIRKTNANFFIVSNNLQSTVSRNISDQGLMHKFKKIIGCDSYYSIKPSTLSWQKLVSEFDLKTSDTLIVGDSPQTDGVYAKNIGLPYFQIPSFI